MCAQATASSGQRIRPCMHGSSIGTQKETTRGMTSLKSHLTPPLQHDSDMSSSNSRALDPLNDRRCGDRSGGGIGRPTPSATHQEIEFKMKHRYLCGNP
jgi:hypothetical protein